MNNNETALSEKRYKKFYLSDNAKLLLLCFAVPFFSMIFLYCTITVWPLGKHSVLVLDLNAQYIYYFEELRNIILEGDSILYSFNRALGGEFMGIFAYYLSSPFSLIVALFPKENITEAMYLILVLKTGCCGLSFGYYLTKKRSLKPIYTVIFALLYALSSYVVVLQHNVMWIDNVIIFPIILLAVDELICRGKFKLYVISLVYSIMSNFYIGYMTCLFVLVWFFVRYFMLEKSERNPNGTRAHFPRTLCRIAVWSIVACMISAIIILPVYYSLTFGKLEFSDPKYTPKQLFDFADLLTKSFFGSYDTVRPAGMPFIYCGTLALILAPLYFISSEFPTRRKVGYAVMMLFLIIGFNFNIADIIWHGMQRPNWMNSRFAFMFVCLMLIMASSVMEKLGKIGENTVQLSSVLWCAGLVILAKIGYDNLPDFLAVWTGIALFIAFAAILPSCVRFAKNPETCKKAAGALCAVVIIEALGNGVAMLYSLDDDVTYSKRSSYRSMNDTYKEAVDIIDSLGDDTFYRAEKLVHRKKNDNFAIGINGLSNSTSTLNARAIDLLAQFGFASMSHWSLYAGATPVSDALFGIKYIMADETDDKPVMDYIHNLYTLKGSTDDEIDVYENPYALSVAYSVNKEILEYDVPPKDDEEDKYTDPFTYMNNLLSVMTGETITVWTRCDIKNTDYVGCDISLAEGHRGYIKDGSPSSYLKYVVNIEYDMPVFVYFPSDYPRDAVMKLNGKEIGNYFEGEDFSIRELGTFEPGEELDFKLYLKEEKMYVRTGCGYFWYFDENAFKDAIAMLKGGVMTAYSEKDDEIHGTITVPENNSDDNSSENKNSVIMTTIPYDAGWRVTVDGNEVETCAVLNDTLLAVEAEPGEHELIFEYKPDCVKYGLIITFAGILIFTAACVSEYFVKKHLAAKSNGNAYDNLKTFKVMPDESVLNNSENEDNTDD